MAQARLSFAFALLVTVALVTPTVTFAASKGGLKLQKHHGGFFSIQKPSGWKVTTAGECSSFAFVIRDPSAGLRQVFMFSEVGPVYASEGQREIDRQYVNMGGYGISWLDMPVVNPLTPAEFLKQFHAVAKSQTARMFMPQCPKLENLRVVSSKPLSSPITGGTTALVRAVFTYKGKPGQGMFVVTVAPFMPYTGAPGGGTGYAFLMAGITAPKSEFAGVQADLIKCLESFTVSSNWVRNCMAASAQKGAALRSGNRQCL